MSRASRASAAAAAASAAAERSRREEADRRAEEDRRRYEEERQKRQTFNAPTNFYGMSDKFNASAQDWLGKNKDNPTVGAAGADLAYNSLTSAAQRESDVQYAKEMTPLATEYQRGVQGIASDAEDRRIASQNQADLKIGQQKAETERYGYDTTKYGYDQTRATAQDTSQSEERQIGLTGTEQRKTLAQGTDETLRLRRDARGAIASGGRRFYA